jgi:hypothetical protein
VGQLWTCRRRRGEYLLLLLFITLLFLERAHVCTSPFDPMMLTETVPVHAGLQTACDAERRMTHTSCSPLLPLHQPLRVCPR